MPLEIFHKLGQAGFMGMSVPPSYGGVGLDRVAAALVIEELARHDGSVALSVASHNALGVGHLLIAGTEQQRRKYLPLARGQELSAWALTEPGSGSEASCSGTRAHKQENKWILNGTKTFITHGSTASVIIVMATTISADKRCALTAFVVERDTPGVACGPPLPKMGMRASNTTELFLERVELPDDSRLGGYNCAQ